MYVHFKQIVITFVCRLFQYLIVNQLYKLSTICKEFIFAYAISMYIDVTKNQVLNS